MKYRNIYNRLELELELFSVLRLRSEKWMNVQVGDIIRLENNQFVTVSEPEVTWGNRLISGDL